MVGVDLTAEMPKKSRAYEVSGYAVLAVKPD